MGMTYILFKVKNKRKNAVSYDYNKSDSSSHTPLKTAHWTMHIALCAIAMDCCYYY